MYAVYLPPQAPEGSCPGSSGRAAGLQGCRPPDQSSIFLTCYLCLGSTSLLSYAYFFHFGGETLLYFWSQAQLQWTNIWRQERRQLHHQISMASSKTVFKNCSSYYSVAEHITYLVQEVGNLLEKLLIQCISLPMKKRQNDHLYRARLWLFSPSSLILSKCSSMKWITFI